MLVLFVPIGCMALPGIVGFPSSGLSPLSGSVRYP